jgi:hypothetical protein
LQVTALTVISAAVPSSAASESCAAGAGAGSGTVEGQFNRQPAFDDRSLKPQIGEDFQVSPIDIAVAIEVAAPAAVAAALVVEPVRRKHGMVREIHFAVVVEVGVSAAVYLDRNIPGDGYRQ